MISLPQSKPWLVAALVFLLALALRLPGLESRPVHPDEAGNAYQIDGLLTGKGYRYLPHDHHGPTLYHLTASVLKITGAEHIADLDIWMLRIFTASAGAALATLAGIWFLKHFDLATALWTAGLLSLAAPFVYYSGIFIHESFLLLLILSWFIAAWHYATIGGTSAALLAGLFAGLLLATKETSAPILCLLSLAIGLTARPPWRRVVGGLGQAGCVGCAVVLIFFSDFGRHPERAFDLFHAIGAQVSRSHGQDHAYPWFTYARWFFAPVSIGWPWSSWLILIFGGLGLWLHRKQRLVQALALSAALLTLFFSVLPYKTPWLILAPLLPATLLAGLGSAWFFTYVPKRRSVLITSLALTALLASETYLRCLRHAVDPANPFAYSPGSPDLQRLENALAASAAATPHTPLLVQVVARDYWPLPWTLRNYATGYWAEPPATLKPGFVLIEPAYIGALAGLYMDFTPYEIRPGLTLFLARNR